MLMEEEPDSDSGSASAESTWSRASATEESRTEALIAEFEHFIARKPLKRQERAAKPIKLSLSQKKARIEALSARINDSKTKVAKRRRLCVQRRALRASLTLRIVKRQ